MNETDHVQTYATQPISAEITDADRWAYVRDELSRAHDLKIDGTSYYSLRHLRPRATSFTEAVDKAINELRSTAGR